MPWYDLDTQENVDFSCYAQRNKQHFALGIGTVSSETEQLPITDFFVWGLGGGRGSRQSYLHALLTQLFL